MEAAEIASYVAQLKEAKERVQETLNNLAQDGLMQAMTETTSELSAYDNHPGDLGTEMFERSKDMALRDNARLLLQSIDHALDRAAVGQYGRCEICGREINRSRLEAIPWATTCIQCQRQKENPHSIPRPLEEEVLKPPFHRSFLDTDPRGQVGFDGEDAWQAVAKWGNSDTPQDIPGSYDYKALWANSNEQEGIVDNADLIPVQYASTENTERKKVSPMVEGKRGSPVKTETINR